MGFEKWNHRFINVTQIAESLIDDGTALLGVRKVDHFDDLSVQNVLKMLSSWKASEECHIILFLRMLARSAGKQVSPEQIKA